jgi:glycerol-3-phosphate acyltransferase PlsY
MSSVLLMAAIYFLVALPLGVLVGKWLKRRNGRYERSAK